MLLNFLLKFFTLLIHESFIKLTNLKSLVLPETFQGGFSPQMKLYSFQFQTIFFRFLQDFRNVYLV